jgi:ABC-type phosphate transport system substrate-binding protein
MRRILPACRTGLSAAAALVLLTACGGSGNDDEQASAGDQTTSSASETSAAAAGSDFCTEAAGVQERVGATFSGTSDPNSLPDVLQAAASEIRDIEPPDEIAADWTNFADGIEQIAAAAQVDFNDQAAVATFQQQATALQQKFGASFTKVENYLSDQCGLTGEPTETSAPTS